MKIAILTNFQEFLPGYSLTGIVKDQVRMLKRYGHEVHLFVNDQYHGEEFPEGVIMHKSIPFCHLYDFQSITELTGSKREYQEVIDKTVEVLRRELEGFDIVFTHDFVFTGWFMPYGQACKTVGKDLPDLRWMHWIHSTPTGRRDFWDIQSFGHAHKVIYPNRADLLRTAEEFRGSLSDVRMIPHIKDLRSWYDFGSESCKFIDDYHAVMQADIVQIYPASVDRLEAKRVREVLLMFSRLKAMGRSVCLVIANQWATTVRHKQSVDQYKKIAQRNGLKPGVEFIFTSDWQWDQEKQKGKYEVGLPKEILRDLMSCMNLFIFPTREESFGLVLPEAVLSSGCFCVLNKSLDMQAEISGGNALYFDFGSYYRDLNVVDEGKYFKDIASVIIGRMAQSEAIMTRTFMRQSYNYDFLYHQYYEPIMAESKIWMDE